MIFFLNFNINFIWIQYAAYYTFTCCKLLKRFGKKFCWHFYNSKSLKSNFKLKIIHLLLSPVITYVTTQKLNRNRWNDKYITIKLQIGTEIDLCSNLGYFNDTVLIKILLPCAIFTVLRKNILKIKWLYYIQPK